MMNRQFLSMLLLLAAPTGTVYGHLFEVASIRESDPAFAGLRGTIEPTPGGLSIRNTTLKAAITWAYDEPGARVGVVGGPPWADSVRYDIVARPAAPTSNPDQLRIMLRALLAERFRLVVSAVRTESAVYALTVDQKGHKLRPAKTDGSRSIQPDATGFTFQNATMNDLQLFLLSRAGLDRPVLNRTGLDGAFDFKLAMLNVADTEEARKAAVAGASPIAFVDALAPLGLKLEPQQVPRDVITIEKVEKPSEN